MKDAVDFLILFSIVTLIVYPIFGGVMYGDPWKWPIKETDS